MNTPDTDLACEVAVIKALGVAGKKGKNNRPRSARGPEWQYRDIPDHQLHLRLTPSLTASDVDDARLLDGAWTPLTECLTAHGLTAAHIRCITTACDEYVRACLTAPAAHDRDVLARYLAEAHRAAASTV